MSEQLQLRSGSASNIAAFTGAAAECVVDSTNNRLVLQDGATAGGFAAAKLAEVLPPVTVHTASATISSPGLHIVTTAGIPLTLPSAAGWVDGLGNVKAPIRIKALTTGAPNTVIAGTVDGSSSGANLGDVNQYIVLEAYVAGSTWVQTG